MTRPRAATKRSGIPSGANTTGAGAAPSFFDQKRIGAGDPENDRAINALRAATTAAHSPDTAAHGEPSAEEIAQIHNLHAMTLDADRRARRVLAKPGARRKAEYAAMAETAALQLVGFSSYEQFAAVHEEEFEPSPTESDETILRIRALLTELGVDPLGDPLRAASDFLTAHETELADRDTIADRMYGEGAGGVYTSAAADTSTAGIDDIGTNAAAGAIVEPPKMDWSKPIVPYPVTADIEQLTPQSVSSELVEAESPTAEVVAPETVSPETVSPETVFAATIAAETVAAEPVVAEPVVAEPVVSEPLVSETLADEPFVAEPVVSEPIASESIVSEPVAAYDGAVAETGPEVDLPWVAAAQFPIAPIPSAPTPSAPIPSAPISDGIPAEIAAGTPPAAPLPDDDVVDRWINAEARAERMHAEVDRAQAELVAMLARSADLEQTVVSRADDLDLANVELDRVRRRVEELEQSIAQSDTERDEIDRALTASRDRVTELEATLLEREDARAQADRERVSALATVDELEATLTARSSELELARINVAELEAALIAQAVHVDDARGDVGVARAEAVELTTELENTKRALDALDAHAEAIEAELAEARRVAGSPETRRELDAVRQELTEARHELGHLELQRAETDRLLAHDRIELQQLQHTLAQTRDEAIDALDELTEMRRAIEETQAQVEAAEHARNAVTIDAADLLARAEAEATSLLERANRDAEAIRQDARFQNEGVRHDQFRHDEFRGGGTDSARAGDAGISSDETLRELAEQVERLERKVAKQRRRLDRIAQPTDGGSPAGRAKAPGAKVIGSKIIRAKSAGVMVATPETDPAEVIASAERDAAEIRRAAWRDRERFREEIVGLLTRLAAVDEDDD